MRGGSCQALEDKLPVVNRIPLGCGGVSSEQFEFKNMAESAISPIGLCCHFSLNSKLQRRRHSKRRKRKSTDQLCQLKEEFEKHSEWTKELMTKLALKTGLSEAQVYKWGWDHKKRFTFKSSEHSSPTLGDLFAESAPLLAQIKAVPVTSVVSNLLCFEVTPPSSLDVKLYSVQKSYRVAVEKFARERV
jgi:hypothetical protein